MVEEFFTSRDGYVRRQVDVLNRRMAELGVDRADAPELPRISCLEQRLEEVENVFQTPGFGGGADPSAQTLKRVWDVQREVNFLHQKVEGIHHSMRGESAHLHVMSRELQVIPRLRQGMMAMEQNCKKLSQGIGLAFDGMSKQINSLVPREGEEIRPPHPTQRVITT